MVDPPMFLGRNRLGVVAVSDGFVTRKLTKLERHLNDALEYMKRVLEFCGNCGAYQSANLNEQKAVQELASILSAIRRLRNEAEKHNW